VEITSGTDACFGARGPAGGNSWRTGRKSNLGITQKACTSERKSLMV
jgi:hypothetical protein